MIISSAKFIISNTDINRCPKPDLPEYAFIGRSNVGKSSLINKLTRQKKLAKTSSRPGKTQLINHFLINKQWYLVDLPGYGYAKVSKSKRKAWSGFIKEYILKRQNLLCLFVLIDSRIPPQKSDLEFIYELGIKQVPFALVFTKIDKLSKNEMQKTRAAFFREMKKQWDELPPYFITSAKTGEGSAEILDFIEKTNHLF